MTPGDGARRVRFLRAGLCVLATTASLLMPEDHALGVSALVVALAVGVPHGALDLEDALSVLSFGANSVAMCVVGSAGALTRDFFVGDSRYFLVSYLFIGKWVRDLAHWAAAGWVDAGAGPRQPFVEQVLIDGGIASLYVAAVGLGVGALLGVGREA